MDSAYYTVAGLPQAMMEPGENWLEETFQRHFQTPLIPGWELPLDWTTPDVSGDKKVGGDPSSPRELRQEVQHPLCNTKRALFMNLFEVRST